MYKKILTVLGLLAALGMIAWANWPIFGSSSESTLRKAFRLEAKSSISLSDAQRRSLIEELKGKHGHSFTDEDFKSIARSNKLLKLYEYYATCQVIAAHQMDTCQEYFPSHDIYDIARKNCQEAAFVGPIIRWYDKDDQTIIQQYPPAHQTKVKLLLSKNVQLCGDAFKDQGPLCAVCMLRAGSPDRVERDANKLCNINIKEYAQTFSALRTGSDKSQRDAKFYEIFYQGYFNGPSACDAYWDQELTKFEN